MEKSQIMPPDELDIDTETSDILSTFGDKKQVARHSKIKYWRLCAMLRPDDPSVDNTISETAALIYGCVVYDREKAKRIFNILYRLAVQWGLVDERPVDVLKLAADRLRAIRKEDIEAMTEDQRTLTELYAGELREVAGHVYEDALRARIENEARPRNAELDGRVRVGSPSR